MLFNNSKTKIVIYPNQIIIFRIHIITKNHSTAIRGYKGVIKILKD